MRLKGMTVRSPVLSAVTELCDEFTVVSVMEAIADYVRTVAEEAPDGSTKQAGFERVADEINGTVDSFWDVVMNY